MVRTPKRFTSVGKLSWRGLIPQFIAIIILPLTILLLAIPFASFSLHQHEMRALVSERDERTARSVAAAIGEQLTHRAAAVKGIALRVADGVLPADILATSAHLLPDFDGGLAFYSAEGSLLATAGQNQMTKVDPDLLALLRRSGSEPVFSAPFGVTGTNQMFVLVAASANQTTIAMGAFSATALLRSTLMDASVTDQEASTFIVDAHSRIVYQAGLHPLSESSTKHPGIQQSLRGERGAAYIQYDTDGSEVVVASSPVAPVGWALVIEERWEHVTTPLLRRTEIAPLVLVPLLLLALIGLWFGIRQIVRPLQTLAMRASKLAWGDFETIQQPVGGISEIRRLQTELIQMASKVKTAQAILHDYIGAITTAQEEERRRLARELHDDTLQALIALNQRTQLARLALTDSPAIVQLTEIQTLTEQTMSNLRRLTRALRPIYLEDLGLVTALEMLVRETSQNAELSIEFHRRGQEQRLPADAELALYRMAQEALNNVTRHAQASQASLAIQFEPEAVTVTVSDNGHGFKAPETPNEFAGQGHFGLLGLHERAELIGAHLDIQAAPGWGTQITLRLPIKERT